MVPEMTKKTLQPTTNRRRDETCTPQETYSETCTLNVLSFSATMIYKFPVHTLPRAHGRLKDHLFFILSPFLVLCSWAASSLYSSMVHPRGPASNSGSTCRTLSFSFIGRDAKESTRRACTSRPHIRPVPYHVGHSPYLVYDINPPAPLDVSSLGASATAVFALSKRTDFLRLGFRSLSSLALLPET